MVGKVDDWKPTKSHPCNCAQHYVCCYCSNLPVGLIFDGIDEEISEIEGDKSELW